MSSGYSSSEMSRCAKENMSCIRHEEIIEGSYRGSHTPSRQSRHTAAAERKEQELHSSITDASGFKTVVPILEILPRKHHRPLSATSILMNGCTSPGSVVHRLLLSALSFYMEFVFDNGHHKRGLEGF